MAGEPTKRPTPKDNRSGTEMSSVVSVKYFTIVEKYLAKREKIRG